MNVVSVALLAFPKNKRDLLEFSVPDSSPLPHKGDLIEVPLGDKRVQALVFLVEHKNAISSLKNIGRILQTQVLPEKYIDFIQSISRFYFCNPSFFLQKVFLPSQKTDLTSLQFISPAEIDKKLSILMGLHFSSKNAIVLQNIRETLEKKLPVLFFVPSYFALLQAHNFLTQFFPDKKIVLSHSSLTPVQKKKLYSSIESQSFDICIGTGSSVFLPFSALGLIIVHEYADESYTSVVFPYENYSHIVRLYAEKFSIPLLLLSVLPKIEDIAFAKSQNIQLSQVADSSVPPIAIVDMNLERQNGNDSLFSAVALQAIQNTLSQNNQVLLYINKKGMHWTMVCEKCGASPISPFSGLKMGVFKNKKGEMFLKCTHSGHTQSVPTVCPECSGAWRMVGSGTQEGEEVLQKLFPQARILRFDKDAMPTNGKIKEAYELIQEKKVDIIITTSFGLRGFSFPHVSLVIDTKAENHFLFPVFSAEEKALRKMRQLLDKIGVMQNACMIVQTNTPHLNVFKIFQNFSLHWIPQTLSERKKFFHPPFGIPVRLIKTGKKKQSIENALAEWKQKYTSWFFHMFAPTLRFFDKKQEFEGTIEGVLHPEHHNDLYNAFSVGVERGEE